MSSMQLAVLLTVIRSLRHIWRKRSVFKANFPPRARVAKPLVELVRASPWPGGPEFKPQLRMMMSCINDVHPGFKLWRGEMHEGIPL